MWFISPFAIAVILFIVGFTSTFTLGNWISEKIIDWINLDQKFETEWLERIRPFLTGLIGWTLKILIFLFLSSLLKYIVLIVASPILALLSERIDEIISGKKFPFHFGQFLHDMLRGILVTLRNLFLELLIWIACFLFCFIPIVGQLLGWLVLPLRSVVAWYFLGYSMMDYTYERRKMKITEGTNFTRRHKGIAIGNGFVFSVLLWIPFLGISIAPVLSCVAATLALLERMGSSESIHH
jgi:CysZ protein